MKMTTRGWLLAAVLALGCGTEAPAPDKPTWVDDVQPIMQANCFHCHGANANYAKNGTKRWDVYDITKMEYADLGFMPSDALLGAYDNTNPAHAHNTALIHAYITDTGDGRMPPPPASALSARDIQVIENWTKTGFTEGQHSPNHKPKISWLVKGKRYQVLDDDGDQVLGQLDCGGMMVPVLRSGTSELPADVSPPCAATLYDGFEQSTGNLN